MTHWWLLSNPGLVGGPALLDAVNCLPCLSSVGSEALQMRRSHLSLLVFRGHIEKGHPAILPVSTEQWLWLFFHCIECPHPPSRLQISQVPHTQPSGVYNSISGNVEVWFFFAFFFFTVSHLWTPWWLSVETNTYTFAQHSCSSRAVIFPCVQ